MKKLVIYSVLICATALFSCKKTDLLDAKINTDLNEQTVFSDSARTIDFLFGIYADVAHNWQYYRRPQVRGSFSDASDESVNRYANQTFHYPINGALSSSIWAPPITDAWTVGYKNIRRANLYLAKVSQSPISDKLKASSKAEARFLRAWFYEEMMRHYAAVPILGDTLFSIDADFNQPRNSYEECVNYLVSEMDAIAPDLPLEQQPENHGRITRGAALALKARVLLYAASPLFNGGGFGETEAQKRVVGYPTYDATRWNKAAQAAQDVVNLGVYSLYEDNVTAPGFGFNKVFLMRKNPEYIFQFMLAPNRSPESWIFAPSRGGSAYSLPTQNLAEAFGMIDGKPIVTGGPIEQSPLFDPQDPFKDRDPRFNYTICYNGTPWFLGATKQKEPIYTYVGAANDGFDKRDYHTGYFWRKMLDDNTAWTGGANTERCLPLIRYAEVVLGYAEASNESDNIDVAYEQLKILRKRAGIHPGSDGLYGLRDDLKKDEMRIVIQNERMVELAYEEHRFWDVRRWKIAMVTQNVMLNAMKITKTGDTYQYEIIPVNHPNRQLQTIPRTHLLPINQAEIGRNAALIQNPGY